MRRVTVMLGFGMGMAFMGAYLSFASVLPQWATAVLVFGYSVGAMVGAFAAGRRSKDIVP